MDTMLAAVMKNIADALQFDYNNKLEDAYVKYAECVLQIMTTLLKDVKARDNKVYISTEVVKFVKLGSQCIERIAIVVNSLSRTSPMPDQKLHTEMTASSHPSTATLDREPHTPGFRFSAPVPPIPEAMDRPTYQRTRSLGPMEMAYRQNQQLMRAYKARQAKLNARNAFNLSLTLQRKMAENLAIAKLQEEALAKKMQERQKRLDELANQKFGFSDKETKEIYKQVMIYEQDAKWLHNMRKELEENPTDQSVISKVMNLVLSCKDHPITEKLKAYQFKIYERIYPLVSDKLEGLKRITVPLDKSLWPSKPEVKDTLQKDKNNKDSGDNFEEKVRSHSLEETTLRKDSSATSLSEGEDESKKEMKTMEEISEDVKEDLEKAMDMGDKLQHKLEEDREKTMKMAKRISLDVETYQAENMDDLFDDEEEEGEDGEHHPEEERSIESQDRSDTKEKISSGDVKEESFIKDRSDSAQSLEVPEEIERLRVEAHKRHLKGISEDVHRYFDKLQEMFICVYEQLSSPEGRDYCYSKLEEPFFKPIWQYLLALYRYANKSSELQVAHVMTVHMNSLPEALGVKKKLQLQSHDQDLTYIPYKPAIEELQTISSQVTLLGKLECLVKSSRLICRCVEEYYSNADKSPSIGADDLLPILGYVIIRMGNPQIVSECSILEEFIHEGYIMGEEGYCLTSVQTALQYLKSLSVKLLTSDE
ncbi:VPS9 domain-containing protein 1-like [Saccostrea echinata]|uniref:VPS9 domain-containing protein 1-like n=1 Tax=Saccostrea echinata TaxID=191078 RepID=UPI002A813F94|nr:VPS9 domain-containing protein 1-like [Saccostrea echinata]